MASNAVRAQTNFGTPNTEKWKLGLPFGRFRKSDFSPWAGKNTCWDRAQWFARITAMEVGTVLRNPAKHHDPVWDTTSNDQCRNHKAILKFRLRHTAFLPEGTSGDSYFLATPERMKCMQKAPRVVSLCSPDTKGFFVLHPMFLSWEKIGRNLHQDGPKICAEAVITRMGRIPKSSTTTVFGCGQSIVL